MKLTQKTNIEEASIGDFDEIQSGIAAENLGLALNMVSKNLYSNPIGSIIREIVSNAVDANVDAGIDKPVIVEIKEENENWYFEVIDNGTGITPEAFKSIYMNWFSSDKRNTNDKIGGWGLGSKSPLAYVDDFELITTVNGIRYHYSIYNADPISKSTLLLKEETTRGNGTTIRIALDDNDLWTFYEECKKQLAYFDNVYVKHDKYYYNNEFKVYEAEHFKVSSQPPYDNMHIVLGQVTYPIDWEVIGLKSCNHLPIGLKFNIGELPVVLSRESIDYGKDSAVQKIQDKIITVVEDLKRRYEENSQNEEFYTYLKSLYTNSAAQLKIGIVTLNLKNVAKKRIIINGKSINLYRDRLPTLIEGLYTITILNSGTVSRSAYNTTMNMINAGSVGNLYLRKTSLNTYDSIYLNDVIIIKRKPIDKTVFNIITKLLGIENRSKYTRFSVSRVHYYSTPNTTKLVYDFVKEFRRLVEQNTKTYEGSASEEWIAEYKLQLKRERESKKGIITVYNLNKNRQKVNLADHKTLTFYFNKKEAEENNTNLKKALCYYHIITSLSNGFFRKGVKFYFISDTVIRKVKHNNYFIDAKLIFKIKELKNVLYKTKLRSTYDYLADLPVTSYYPYDKKYWFCSNIFKKGIPNTDVIYHNFNIYGCDQISLIDNLKEEFDELTITSKNLLGIEQVLKNIAKADKDMDILHYLVQPFPEKYRSDVLMPFIKKHNNLNYLTFIYDKTEKNKRKQKVTWKNIFQN
jgi:anti-sigma regulatory factor (Ser/Thr protein kinase)